MAIEMRKGIEYRAAPAHPVKPGQIWASTHKVDRQTVTRQHREVTEVWSETDRWTEHVQIYAHLVTVTPDGHRERPQRVKCTSRSVKGHRLVGTIPVGVEGDHAR
jgi:hypothetical protein